MERLRCEECGGKITKKKIDYCFLGEFIGKFDADVCANCGEQVFTEETGDKINKIIKQKGLWGLGAKSKVNQIGTSVGVTINKKIAEFMKLKKGENVVIYPENKKRLIIDKV